MAIVNPEGFAQVIIPFKNSALSRTAACVYAIELDGPVVDGLALCDALTVAFADSIGQGVDSAVTMGPTTIRLGGDPGSPGPVYSGGYDQVGLGTDVSSPAQVAVLFRKLTAAGGRANRGRMYVPWACGAVSVDEGGFIDAGAVASFNGVAADFLTELLAIAGGMVLLHDESSPVTAPTAVTGLVCQGQVATQRRRLGR